MTGDKIDQLIEMVTKQNELLGTGGEKHATDATALKKEWFNYVLLSLEKANSAINNLETEQHTAAKDLLTGLVKLKEEIRTEMSSMKSKYDINLDKLEARIEKSVDSLNAKVDSISIPTVKQELKFEITKLKSEILQDISKTKEELKQRHQEDLDPLKTNVNTLLVKVGLFGILGGLVGSGLVALVIKLAHSYLTGGVTPAP